jgi:CrcB protein
MNGLLVFLGGGVGAVARYLMANAVSHYAAPRLFPYHTLSINLLGALAIGMITEFLALKASWPESARFFLITGILGGFTTFSAFSLESALMIERGDYAACAIYIAASVIGTIILVFAGTAVVRAVL